MSMGRDLCWRGHEFESQLQILDRLVCIFEQLYFLGRTKINQKEAGELHLHL